MKKEFLKNRKLKRTATALARLLGYSETVRLKDRYGCPVFEPVYKDGSVEKGLPIIFIVRNGAASYMTEEETAAYLKEEYNIALA